MALSSCNRMNTNSMRHAEPERITIAAERLAQREMRIGPMFPEPKRRAPAYEPMSTYYEPWAPRPIAPFNTYMPETDTSPVSIMPMPVYRPKRARGRSWAPSILIFTLVAIGIIVWRSHTDVPSPSPSLSIYETYQQDVLDTRAQFIDRYQVYDIIVAFERVYQTPNAVAISAEDWYRQCLENGATTQWVREQMEYVIQVGY